MTKCNKNERLLLGNPELLIQDMLKIIIKDQEDDNTYIIYF